MITAVCRASEIDMFYSSVWVWTSFQRDLAWTSSILKGLKAVARDLRVNKALLA